MRASSTLRRLVESRRGAMVFTVSQMFLGAITLGIALFRGTESHLGFHYETLLGHANYAASTLAADHARAANAIANNNVISAAVMGPRFAVEADNITMDENAQIACPQVHNDFMRFICKQYKKNKPRARGKLAWARAKQASVWQSMSKLSGDMDRVAGLRAIEKVDAAVKSVDGAVTIRVEDPSARDSIWGTSNKAVGCTLAQKDALDSPMPGSAFPLLMPTLLGGLPQALVQVLPQAICGAMGNTSPIKLAGVPSVAKNVAESCAAVEREFQCEVQRASSAAYGTTFYGCGASSGAVTRLPRDHLRRNGDDGSLPGADRAGDGVPQFSSEVAPYVQCAVLSPSARTQRPQRGGYAQRAGRGGQISTCTFDMDKCSDDKLVSESKSFLDALDLPSSPALGDASQSTRAPTDPDWNHSDRMRVCVYASKPVNETIVGISDAIRTLASFGMATPSSSLRETYEYRACGKWYFPDGQGEFASVAHEQQPFVAAWKFALTRGHADGGGR